jgi:hypothetical protein
VSGNGSPLAKPSPATETRVAAHLRKARGKSPAYLARRYRRALRGYLDALGAGRGEAGLALGGKIRYGT